MPGLCGVPGAAGGKRDRAGRETRRHRVAGGDHCTETPASRSVVDRALVGARRRERRGRCPVPSPGWTTRWRTDSRRWIGGRPAKCSTRTGSEPPRGSARRAYGMATSSRPTRLLLPPSGKRTAGPPFRTTPTSPRDRQGRPQYPQDPTTAGRAPCPPRGRSSPQPGLGLQRDP